MKNIIIFVIMILFIVTISGKLFSQDNKDFGNAVLNTIHTRKSVRNFTGDSVSTESLQKIIAAGMCAPTAMNKQPWSFVVVQNKETLVKLFGEKFINASAAIVVCAIPGNAAGGKTEFAIIDCALAGMNILLATESLGLGAVWTAVYPDTVRMNSVRSVLNIPENIIPVNLIPVGVPTGVDKPKDKFKEENIHWNTW
jgi:nitroreductase